MEERCVRLGRSRTRRGRLRFSTSDFFQRKRLRRLVGGQAQLLDDSYLERPSFLRSYPMRIRVLRMDSAGQEVEWRTNKSLRSSPSNWTDRIPDCSLNSSSMPTRHASQRMPSRRQRNDWVFRAWWMLYAPVILIRRSSMPSVSRCLRMVSKIFYRRFPRSQYVSGEPLRPFGVKSPTELEPDVERASIPGEELSGARGCVTHHARCCGIALVG